MFASVLMGVAGLLQGMLRRLGCFSTMWQAVLCVAWLYVMIRLRRSALCCLALSLVPGFLRASADTGG